MSKVYVIAPDIYSGNAFNNVLNEYGVETELAFYNISPRVVENKISKSQDITNDLNNIFKNLKGKVKDVVMACNTLQLWLPKIDKKYTEHIKVYTTFEACEWKFKKLKNKPLWLGTTPLTRTIKKFPTLITLNDEATQEMVQELVWRIKMYGDDDIKTAPDRVRNDSRLSKSNQRLKIIKIKNEIISSLKQHKIKDTIVGCTELPLVFDKEKESGINFHNPAKILADYICSSK